MERCYRRLPHIVAGIALLVYLTGSPFVFAGRTKQKLETINPPNMAKHPHQLIYFIWYDISDASVVKLSNVELTMAIDDILNSTYQGERIVRTNEATRDPEKYTEPIKKGCPKDPDDCDAIRISLKRDGDAIRLTVFWHDGRKGVFDSGDLFHPRPQYIDLDGCSNLTGDPRKIDPCKFYIIKRICETLSKHKHGGVSQ